jgi:coenzyme F420-reducing hydrogenase gamma subunit
MYGHSQTSPPSYISDEVQSEEEIDFVLQDGSVNGSDMERAESVVRKRSKASHLNNKNFK